jgi:hypothetical protein
MDRRRFEHLMGKARTFQLIGDRPDYWAGYQRGLQRRFHGEDFGTLEEHHKWLALAGDETGKDLGQGYWDGLNET